ncbi:hypothetical protein Hte_012628 [Hypoxylon texense]
MKDKAARMTKQTIQDLAPVLEGAERRNVSIDWPEQASAGSSYPFPLSKTFPVFKKRTTPKKPGYCTLEIYDVTGHPVAPRVRHRDGCVCERAVAGEGPDDKALTRRYLGRWYEARCDERDGLQHWYWDILVGLCTEWDMELPEGCAKPTCESVMGR